MAAEAMEGINAAWRFEDFFTISAEAEAKVKRKLAAKMQLRYTDVIFAAKPFALPSPGVTPYDVDAIKTQFQEYHKCKGDMTMSSADRINKLESLKSVTTCINACMVRWRPTMPPNVGYIKHWAETNLDHWDSGIERRAGGIDADVAWSAQHFVLTNTSSFYALVATVVLHLHRGTPIPEKLLRAVSCVRIHLFMDANTDEIIARPLSFPAMACVRV